MNTMPGQGDRSFAVSVKGVALTPDDAPDVRRQKLARIIVDSMYQFLGLLDVDGTVIEINEAALEGAGVALSDVVGRPFWEARWWALSEETRQRVRAMVAEARTGRFVRCDIEVYGESRGSRTIIVDFSLTPIYDDAGQVAFLLPEGRNISEKIAIEAELTRKNNEVQAALEKLREIDGFKTKFFANVSHELRTPLTLILGPVNQLLANPLPARENFLLTTIKRNAQSLLQQVNDLLDLARIDAGEMPLVYVCADVMGLLHEVVDSFAAAASEKGIVLAVVGEPEVYADIDRAKFVRVIVNLLSNAFKFTPPGGRIRCSVHKLHGDKLLLSVQDSGPGVPEPLRQAIFDRYAQGEDAYSSKGSGLGLNIVKEFVELHRGTISVLDAPDRGALFQIELPVRAPEGAFLRRDDPGPGTLLPVHELPGNRAPVRVQGGTQGPHILIAEDNPDLRQFLQDVLSGDYRVTLVENGRFALDVVAVDPPDLVITDLMMPEMDGERFIRALREIQQSPVPVLVLSARSDDALRERLLDEFVQDYLIKPFSPQELRARVRNLVTVKRTVDILQRELNSQASDISELTAGLIESRKSLQEGLRALQISEKRWQGFYENTAVGIALVDADGKIMRANPALQKMLGYAGEEIVGLSLVEISEPSARAMTRENVYSLLQGARESYQIHKRYERKDGSFLWANVCASVIPVVDRDEGPRVAVIVEDITAQKNAEDALASMQNDLARVARLTTMGELVASIAHEVNQPLSGIMTNTQAALRWVERDEPDYPEVVAALTRVQRDAAHAGNVIARIRGFLRKEGLKRERIEIPAMLEALIQMLARTLAEAAVDIGIEIADDLPPLFGDVVQLQQVVLNLLVNAVDAIRGTGAGHGRIRVRVAASPAGGVVFSIEDSGPGVPAADWPAIFEAFYSTKRDGLGMGLAISKSIVESHGGQLWIDHADLGGAAFLFRIPGSSS